MAVNPVYEKLICCYESIKEKIPFQPKVALILGSGLGDYADGFPAEGVIDYHEIAGFPVSTVPGHKGRFIFTHVEGTPVVMMQGRVHYYEGYAMSDVVLPARLMRMMGAEGSRRGWTRGRRTSAGPSPTSCATGKIWRPSGRPWPPPSGRRTPPTAPSPSPMGSGPSPAASSATRPPCPSCPPSGSRPWSAACPSWSAGGGPSCPPGRAWAPRGWSWTGSPSAWTGRSA